MPVFLMTLVLVPVLVLTIEWKSIPYCLMTAPVCQHGDCCPPRHARTALERKMRHDGKTPEAAISQQPPRSSKVKACGARRSAKTLQWRRERLRQ